MVARFARLAVLCSLVGVLPAFGAETDEASRPPVEWRSHVTVNDAQGNALYVLTDMHRVADDGQETVVLVVDKATEQRFVMTHKFDFAAHRSLMQIGDVPGKKYVRASYPFPSAGKTLAEMRAELEANPRLFEVADPILTLETTASSHTAHASELPATDTRARWLSDLRESLDPVFLEGLERMRADLFGTTFAEPFYLLLSKHLFHGGCAVATSDANAVAEFPDCAFDKSFGYPCSDRQIEKIAKAKDEKRALPRY